MAGLVLARGIALRGGEATVIERAPADRRIPGPIMLPFQAYDALDEIGVLAPIRALGIDIPPHRNDQPVAISVARQAVLEALREGVPILWEHELVDLLRDGDRVVGVRVVGPDGEHDLPADLVVGADGTGSRVRELAGIPAETRLADTAFVSFRSPLPAPSPSRSPSSSDGRQVTLLDGPAAAPAAGRSTGCPAEPRRRSPPGWTPTGAPSCACCPRRRGRSRA